MTSQRKLKKRAEALGMTGVELQLVETLDEVLEAVRWMQILAYSNQYLLNDKLHITDDERDQILEAATRAVEKDKKCNEWRDRLDRLKAQLSNINRNVTSARKDMSEEALDPPDAGHEQAADEQ